MTVNPDNFTVAGTITQGVWLTCKVCGWSEFTNGLWLVETRMTLTELNTLAGDHERECEGSA